MPSWNDNSHLGKLLQNAIRCRVFARALLSLTWHKTCAAWHVWPGVFTQSPYLFIFDTFLSHLSHAKANAQDVLQCYMIKIQCNTAISKKCTHQKQKHWSININRAKTYTSHQAMWGREQIVRWSSQFQRHRGKHPTSIQMPDKIAMFWTLSEKAWERVGS